jgi:ribosome biogenesis protein ERB1
VVAKYQSGAKWISSISVHPDGDNFILGTYDKKIIWFDVDMGSKPYKNLKYHDKAIRNVQFSQKYPLFSSCSDDGTVNIFYGKVYDDLL